MVELKDCQQKEMEDKLIISHAPDDDGTGLVPSGFWFWFLAGLNSIYPLERMTQ